MTKKFDHEGLNLLIRDRVPEWLEYHFYTAEDGGLGLETNVSITATAEIRPKNYESAEMTVDEVADQLLVAATTFLCTAAQELGHFLHVLHLVLDGESNDPS